MSQHENLTEVTPRIGPIEPVSMSVDYQLPWDRQSNQTACGQTIQYQNGDKNWRVVINGILTIDQLRALDDIRDQDQVDVRTAEFGTFPITFDQLNVTRASENSVGHIEGDYGPLLKFQLQSKELEKDEDPAVEFIN